MNADLQTLWTLATGDYPVLGALDFDAVHRTYGPAFGPWRPTSVGYEPDRPLVTLAVGGAVDDEVAAIRAVAADWKAVADDDRGSNRIPPCPDAPTAGDVALQAPHGLLVRHGLVRLWGSAGGSIIPADLPVAKG